MKTRTTLLLIFLFISSVSIGQLQTGTIKGTVKDKETGELLPFIKIVLLQNSIQKGLATSDFDGKYQFNQIPPGEYTIEARFIGYVSLAIEGVMVRADEVTLIDLQMSAMEETLSCVEVVSYSVPLIDKDGGSSGVTITREDIKRMPNRSSKGIATTVGSSNTVTDSRSESNYYYIDGIKVRGNVNMIDSKDQKDVVITGGIPSNLEDVDEEVETTNDNGSDGLAKRAKKNRIPDSATLYERYNPFIENAWKRSVDESKSTFSIDVDNASYTNFRRFVNNDQLPPKDAIRVEEWLNFFNYSLEAPESSDEHPLKITSEIGACPWAVEDDLLMIKMQGKLAPKDLDELPPSNLVFLIDVSGSMDAPNKLPLVQRSMMQLLDALRKEDNISIVTYAGASQVLLEPTSGSEKQKIINAINSLRSGGGTHGSEGIKTAYDLAEKHFDKSGNNRVIIATDGDWNIGITNNDELKKLIEEKRKTGIYLSVLGFGMYNLNDSMMEMLADNGNGNYAYIDEEKEAIRIFKEEFAGAMHTIAKDVKLQVQFDTTVVQEYRLLGYENRVLENWQFEADTIDAGDLGMGQNVIAFYQIKRKPGANGSIGNLDFRYKQLDSEQSVLLSHPFALRDNAVSSDFDFASCVIEFALCLRESEYRSDAQMARAIDRGQHNLGDKGNKLSYDKRVEFVGLMKDVAKMWFDYVVEDAPELKVPESPKMKLYPNPTSDYVNIEVDMQIEADWSIQIFDMTGALKKVDHFQNSTLQRIDVTEFTPGTYIIKIYSGGENHGYLRMVVN
ncbi:MAG: von Willebrand factor type A domain-containing protein [Crocinitomicaceae bacterium]|nr:von Willebrand factor type A domain-containing protein [Crocinitomicaceae bacterium]